VRRFFSQALPSILFSCFVLWGCPQGDGGEPEPIEALDASATCSDDASGVTWSFSFRVDGPAAEGGTKVYVDGEDGESSTGFVMPVIGEDGQGRLEFSTTVAGTIEGEAPGLDAVPYSCDDQSEVQIRFCATHSSTLDEPCWACGADDGSSPPGGAVDWVGC